MPTRRSFSAEFKAKVVLELISGEKSLAQASREYGIKDTVLSRWKQEFLANARSCSNSRKKCRRRKCGLLSWSAWLGN